MRRSLLFAAAALLLAIPLSASGVSGSFPDRTFAPYVDVLLWPPFSIADAFEHTGHPHYTLAFVTAGGECTPAWGGVIPMEDDHYRAEIEAIRAEGGDVIVSFGGANGIELAMSCPDVDSLAAAYQSVVDRYDLTWIDLDIEGGAVAHRASIDRRNRAVRRIQEANPTLKVAYCLPVLPSGLTGDGLHVVENAAENGVRIDVVNVMAMDYGDGAAPDPEGRMGPYAVDAGNNTRAQLQSRGIQAAIGVTPMIGQNDVASERFTLSDAEQLLAWAAGQDEVTLLSMWSIPRDNGDCPGQLSPVCSGVSQEAFAFTGTFQRFSDGGNLPPTVRITRPGDGAAFDAGVFIFLGAEADDPDGSVAGVTFFLDGRPLTSDTRPPYETALFGAAEGVHELAALATDDQGATRRSRITVFVGRVCTDPAWEPAAVYWGGDSVSHEGHAWLARWWTRGEEPGTTGLYGVWEDLGACGGGEPCACTDRDGDGYGTPACGDCEHPEADCDDTRADVHPGTGETVGDGIDNDCDGVTCGTMVFDGLASPGNVLVNVLVLGLPLAGLGRLRRRTRRPGR